MPGRPRITVLACALVLSLAGCGSNGDGTIPKDRADELVGLLDAIQSDVESQDCTGVPEHASEFADAVNNLPPDVDDKVERGLTEASAHLIALSKDPQQCDAGATGAGGVQSTTPSTTETAATSTSTTTTTTSTAEPDQQQPDDQQSGDQQQGGDQQGNEPAQLPEGQGGGGTGGRTSDSGGLEGGKLRSRSEAKRSRPAVEGPGP